MCGRYSLTTPPALLQELFELDAVPPLAPRYNIAPAQEAPVVRAAAGGGRELALLRWGLPSARGGGSLLVNARAETAARKRSLAEAFARRRCLVPADGFYEWRREGGVRQPYRVTLAGGEPFAFAGLWEEPAASGAATGAFVILTTAAAADLAAIHDRMPAILDRSRQARWLAAASPEELAAALRSPPAAPLAVVPVSTWVNSPRHDDPRCLEPAAPLQPGLFG